jgi:hypothetical protein
MFTKKQLKGDLFANESSGINRSNGINRNNGNNGNNGNSGNNGNAHLWFLMLTNVSSHSGSFVCTFKCTPCAIKLNKKNMYAVLYCGAIFDV